MAEAHLSRTELAGRLQTSRSQLDRLLDPENTSVTLDSLERLARAIGKQLVLRLAWHYNRTSSDRATEVAATGIEALAGSVCGFAGQETG